MIVEIDTTIAYPVIENPSAFLDRLMENNQMLVVVSQDQCDRHFNLIKFSRSRLPIKKVCTGCFRIIERRGVI